MAPSTHRLASLLVLVLAATAVAGCTGTEDAPAPDPLSAREAFEQAQPTVEEWEEDAELVALSGFEGGEDSPALQRERAEEEREAFPLHADTLPGDGRAPQWVMVFLAGEESRTVRVTSEETVWLDDGPQQASPGARAVGDWPVDSTEAIQRVLEDSEELDPIVAASDVSVFFTLGGGSQGARWQVQANSHSVGDQALFFVDARSGEVQNRSQAQTNPRTQTFEGELSRAGANATHEVSVQQNGTRLAVELSWNASASEDGVRLSASLLDGETVRQPANSEERDRSFVARWDGLDEGVYHVEVNVEAWGEADQVDYGLRVHTG